ncbi:MAG: acetyl-CoA carboxylase carboxyl transferase subunit beta, partial [Methylophilaceae bacterium]|nr:acetyl-CoA carboxylase carboxyl transferase subunit beta [Methylophilaceae bacterium]
MSWLDKIPQKIQHVVGNVQKRNMPEGLWRKCEACQSVLYKTDLESNNEVCPQCDHHNRISARARIGFLLDKGEQLEIGANVSPVDSLKFEDSKKYTVRMKEAQKSVKETDALIVVKGAIMEMPVLVAAFEFKFMG